MKPKIHQFQHIKGDQIGDIVVYDYQKDIPFAVKRTFCTINTPDEILRGRHAHYQNQQLLIALKGEIIVTTMMNATDINVYKLDDPSMGLYIPPFCWHTMQYKRGALQLVLASHVYDETDYIRDYDAFLKLRK